MNKMYFRAWLKDEKKMCEVINIYSLDNCTEVTCQAIGGEENDYANYRLDEVILMQGIEIDGKVVYEGDIVKAKIYDDGWEEFKFIINHIFEINELWSIGEWEVVGNIYEQPR